MSLWLNVKSLLGEMRPAVTIYLCLPTDREEFIILSLWAVDRYEYYTVHTGKVTMRHSGQVKTDQLHRIHRTSLSLLL